jgi:hypothetical protein
MNEHDEAFAQKIQRLRHTGVGGVSVPAGIDGAAGAWSPVAAKPRAGDHSTYINMKVDKGWAVANPVTKKGSSQREAEKKAQQQEGSVKVFALTNMNQAPQTPKETAAATPTPTQDTEESIIKEIIALQRKLAALREK